MTHLDLLLQKGPPNGELEAGLDELRRTVLLDGIPSTSDGMVRRRRDGLAMAMSMSISMALLMASAVRVTRLCLAHTPQRAAAADQHVP